MADRINVQVCYATAAREYLRDLTVTAGTTIEQAIRQSGVLTDIPGIDLATQPVGIYGKKRPLDTVLRERDRIEIYRPLVADPKDSRRKRAEKKEAKG
jgi:putative ubiquitin-RnfH superfamily antitoxin RatB of RatAB toxin-antitoxin module